MKIEIRPLEKKRFHGAIGKESITRTKRILVPIDSIHMKYVTGLKEEDLKFLESRMPKVDFSDNYIIDEPHPYWSTYQSALVLEDNTMLLNGTQSPRDFLQIKMAKASKFVANSMEEYENGGYPEATHVIFDKEEEVSIKATKLAVERKIITKLAKATLEEKLNVLMIATKRLHKGNSANYIDVELDSEIKKAPDKILAIISYTKEDLALRGLIAEGMLKRRIVKDGHKFMYQGSSVGVDVESIMAYLKNPENNEFKIRLIEEIKTK